MTTHCYRRCTKDYISHYISLKINTNRVKPRFHRSNDCIVFVNKIFSPIYNFTRPDNDKCRKERKRGYTIGLGRHSSKHFQHRLSVLQGKIFRSILGHLIQYTTCTLDLGYLMSNFA